MPSFSTSSFSTSSSWSTCKKGVKKEWATYLLVDSLYFLVALLHEHEIILPLLLLDHPLTFQFHLEKFSFTLVDLVTLLPLAVVLVILVSDPPLKERFFLSPHHSFDSLSALLQLKLGMPYLFVMQLLEQPILLLLLLDLNNHFLRPGHLLLQLFLMPIPCL